MKLTEEQLETLQDRVSILVTYQETYDEVYDHILTGLEGLDSIEDIDVAIDNMIDEEFGNYKALREMEKLQQKGMRKFIWNKHLQYMLDCLQWPSILFVVLLGILIYCVLSNADNSTALSKSVGIVTYLPFVFVTFVSLFNMYFLSGKKRSVKYSEIYNISGIGYVGYFIIQGVLRFILHAGQNILLQRFDHVLTTLVFVLLIIYTVAFFRLYKTEFKMILA
jgi:hypothetical protein